MRAGGGLSRVCFGRPWRTSRNPKASVGGDSKAACGFGEHTRVRVPRRGAMTPGSELPRGLARGDRTRLRAPEWSRPWRRHQAPSSRVGSPLETTPGSEPCSGSPTDTPRRPAAASDHHSARTAPSTATKQVRDRTCTLAGPPLLEERCRLGDLHGRGSAGSIDRPLPRASTSCPLTRPPPRLSLTPRPFNSVSSSPILVLPSSRFPVQFKADFNRRFVRNLQLQGSALAARSRARALSPQQQQQQQQQQRARALFSVQLNSALGAERGFRVFPPLREVPPPPPPPPPPPSALLPPPSSSWPLL